MIVNTQTGTWGDDGPEQFKVSWSNIRLDKNPKTKYLNTFREADAFTRSMKSRGFYTRMIKVS